MSATALNSSLEQRPQLAKQLEPYVYIPLSSANAGLSAFVFVYFLRKDKAVHQVLRRLLVAMAFFEVLFHACVLALYARRLLTSSAASSTFGDAASADKATSAALLLEVTLRFSLTMRNWTMNFTSWSRVEAVFRPLAARSGSLFKTSHVLGMELLAASVAVLLSILMALAQQQQQLLTQSAAYAVEILFYAYQGLLPATLLFVATCITVNVLHRAKAARKQMTLRQPRSRASSKKLRAAAASRRHSQKEQQAIRIIVALSVSCLILESPTVVCGFIKKKTALTELVVNTLIELDSLFNFLVLTLSTSLGRQLCRRRRLRPLSCSSQSPSHCMNVLHTGLRCKPATEHAGQRVLYETCV